MGILLGLLTALTWGGADFIARFSTHRIGALRSMLYMQLTGFLLLSFLLPALGGWGHLADGSGWQPWAWGFLAGCLNAMAGLALYRAFEIGKMAVVAPLSASYPALTLLLSWMTGERLSAVRTVWMIRLTSTVLTAAVILISKQSMRLPRGEVRWMALSMGVFDTSPFVLSNRGMQMEQIAVISVLGSLYGAVTVGLAAIFLKEHVSRWQWMGIVTIFAGIFLISR